jgi:hypothetical protein
MWSVRFTERDGLIIAAGAGGGVRIVVGPGSQPEKVLALMFQDELGGEERRS